MATVTNKNGYVLDFDAAVEHMDDELREEIHNNFAPCTEQEFFNIYEKAHGVKFGELWELSLKNPTW